MPWHTEKLNEEFTAKMLDEVPTFDAYRQLESRLFEQLREEVYTKTATGPDYELFRYSSGSAADPKERRPDWNRSFELQSDPPSGGVLLLHGMSDSPYSLRTLGEAFHRQGYWIIGMRLPGHGTAPSGLRHIKWEDMAAAVRLGMDHLASELGDRPIHIVGYSTGAPLALDYTLDALDGKHAPVPASLILISPAIGIHPVAGLAGLKDALSFIPGLGSFAYASIEPEFDPYKYNSFAANAGAQVFRLTRSISSRIAEWTKSNRLDMFPPILAFKSTVDATVSTNALVDNLLKPLGPNGHELVLFDINRLAAKAVLLIDDPGPLTGRLMNDATLPFALTLVANETPYSPQVVAARKAPFSKQTSEIEPLNLAWPAGVISLSHVALPFSPNDPLYGQRPPDSENVLFLGQVAIQGERGLLKISSDWLLRLRHNPFYSYLESRSLDWIRGAETQEPAN
jgi:alpha-beta hydrolase superfamily lysophospholipase